jgi:hypothetical protein
LIGQAATPRRLRTDCAGPTPAARIQAKGSDGIDEVLALISQMKEGTFV